MPIIPDLNTDRNYYPDNPQGTEIRATLFGHDAEALSQFGGELGNIGSNLMEQRKRATENDALATAQASDTMWYAQASQQTRMNYTKTNQDGSPMVDKNGQVVYDADGFATDMAQQMADRQKAQIAAMPTGDSQQAYKNASEGYFGKNFAESLAWENATKANTFKNNFDISNNQRSNFYLNQQDPRASINLYNTAMPQQLDAINKTIGTINTPEQAQAQWMETLRNDSSGLMKGLENNPASARVGINLIDSITQGAPRNYMTGEYDSDSAKTEAAYPKVGSIISDKNGQKVISGGGMKDTVMDTGLNPDFISAGMNAKELSAQRDRYQAIVDQANKQDLTALRNNISQVSSIVSSTDPTIFGRYPNLPADMQSITKDVQDAVTNKAMSKTEGDNAQMMIAQGYMAMDARDKFPMMSEEDHSKFNADFQKQYEVNMQRLGITNSLSAFREQQGPKEVADRVWNSLLQQRYKDPSQYVETYAKNPAGQVIGGIPDEQRMQWRMNQAKSINFDNSDLPLTKSESSNFVGAINKAAISDPESAAQMLESLKKNTGSMAGTVVDQMYSQDRLPGYIKTAFQMDSPTAAASIIHNNQPQMKKALEDSINSQPANKKLLDASLDDAIKPTLGAFQPSGGEVVSQNIRNAVRLEAISQMGESNLKPKDAVQNAMDDIVNSQYHILRAGAFMPKNIGGVYTNPEYVNGLMQNMKDNYKDLDVMTPGVSTKGLTPDEIAQKQKDVMGYTQWRTNPDNLGMSLWYPQKIENGKPSMFQPVLSNQIGSDGKNKNISIDFVAASKDPGEAARNYSKSWSEYLRDGATSVLNNANEVQKQIDVSNNASAAVPSNLGVAPEEREASGKMVGVSVEQMKAMDKMPLKGRAK